MLTVVTGAAGFIGSRLVAALNQAGVTKILAVDNLANGAKSKNLARVANDSMAELCRKHPDRFPAFAAAVSMHDVDFSIVEVERAIKMGARGVQTFTNISGHPLDEPRFRPFFAAMAAHELDRGLREEPGKIQAREQQVARAGAARERVAQHGEKHACRGFFNRRVERRHRKGLPQEPGEPAALAVPLEELRHGRVWRDAKRAVLQRAHESQRAETLAEGDAFRKREPRHEPQRLGQPERAHAEPLCIAHFERNAQQRIGRHAHRSHQPEELAIGTDQDVLAVVELGALRDDAPGTAARGLRRLENRDRDLALCERHGRRHAGVAGPHDRYPATHVFQAIQNLRSGVSDVRRSRTLKPSRSISASSAR